MPFVLGAIIFCIWMTPVTRTFGQYAGVAKHSKHEEGVPTNLLRFETSDFDVLAHHNWKRLTEKHARNVIVHWPDGRQTKGIAKHVQDVKTIFAYAPDTRVRTHHVKFGAGDWTCVITEIEGTFTNPLRTSEGKERRPNGKRFRAAVCTVRHWNRKDLVDEEYLFWDNQSLMRQIGLAK
jgi:hypothetical protein